jgi:hypothetical protein
MSTSCKMQLDFDLDNVPHWLIEAILSAKVKFLNQIFTSVTVVDQDTDFNPPIIGYGPLPAGQSDSYRVKLYRVDNSQGNGPPVGTIIPLVLPDDGSTNTPPLVPALRNDLHTHGVKGGPVAQIGDLLYYTTFMISGTDTVSSSVYTVHHRIYKPAPQAEETEVPAGPPAPHIVSSVLITEQKVLARFVILNVIFPDFPALPYVWKQVDPANLTPVAHVGDPAVIGDIFLQVDQ